MKPRITEFELKILSRIWGLDNSATINQILSDWPDAPAPGYTTVLKTLQIMRSKGHVVIKKAGRAYRYSAVRSNTEVSLDETNAIIKRTHSGDRLAFIHGFIDSQDLTADEVEELMKLLASRRDSNTGDR